MQDSRGVESRLHLHAFHMTAIFSRLTSYASQFTTYTVRSQIIQSICYILSRFTCYVKSYSLYDSQIVLCRRIATGSRVGSQIN